MCVAAAGIVGEAADVLECPANIHKTVRVFPLYLNSLTYQPGD